LKKKYIIALTVCLLGVAADQATKTVVEEKLSGSAPVTVISKVVKLDYAQNTGMAFGLFPNISVKYRRPFFTLIVAIAVVIIGHLLRQAPVVALRLPFALGMILAGAFGNLIDRYRWGYVVDFVRVTYWQPNHDWPIFNVADVLISVGIGLLVLDTLLAGDEDEDEDKEEAAAPEEPGEAEPGPCEGLPDGGGAPGEDGDPAEAAG